MENRSSDPSESGLPDFFQPAPLRAAAPEIFVQPSSTGSASAWVVIGASVQGTQHIQSAAPLQDSHAYRLVPSVNDSSIAILAAADGLGSAARSDEGASLAVQEAIAAIEDELAAGIPQDQFGWLAVLYIAFARARQRLEVEADNQGADLRLFSTTLLLAVATQEWIAAGHIGDGAIVGLYGDGRLETLSAPQSGEYANQTYPLTMPEALQIAEFTARRERLAGLALFSDGLQRQALLSPGQTPHAPFFTPLFRQMPGVTDPSAASRKLADFLASPRVCAATDDDKTLVLLARK